jgi:hypothetical protein
MLADTNPSRVPGQSGGRTVELSYEEFFQQTKSGANEGEGYAMTVRPKEKAQARDRTQVAGNDDIDELSKSQESAAFTDPETGVTITHSIDGGETTVHFKVGDKIARGGMENFIDTEPNMHRAHAAPPNLGVEDPAGLAPSPRRANLSADPRIDNYVRRVYAGRPTGTDLNVQVTIRRDPATGRLMAKTYRIEYTPSGQAPGTGTHLATFGYEIRADGRITPMVFDAGAMGSGTIW